MLKITENILFNLLAIVFFRSNYRRHHHQHLHHLFASRSDTANSSNFVQMRQEQPDSDRLDLHVQLLQ